METENEEEENGLLQRGQNIQRKTYNEHRNETSKGEVAGGKAHSKNCMTLYGDFRMKDRPQQHTATIFRCSAEPVMHFLLPSMEVCKPTVV